MNIYVGNLSREVTEDDLRQAFEAFGQVESANIIKDRFSGESRGFGFVLMPSKNEAQSAIDGLNGKDLMGRTVNVNEARPKTGDRRGLQILNLFSIFQTLIGRKPLEFTIGDKRIIPAFEQAIVGMRPGESKNIEVPAEEAFGPYREELVQTIERSQFPVLSSK